MNRPRGQRAGIYSVTRLIFYSCIPLSFHNSSAVLPWIRANNVSYFAGRFSFLARPIYWLICISNIGVKTYVDLFAIVLTIRILMQVTEDRSRPPDIHIAVKVHCHSHGHEWRGARDIVRYCKNPTAIWLLLPGKDWVEFLHIVPGRPDNSVRLSR